MNLQSSAGGNKMTQSATIVQVYQNKHSYKDPQYPLDQCDLYRAELANGFNIFVFSDPALKIGDAVALDDLKPVQFNAPGKFYYSDKSSSLAVVFSDPVVPTSPPTASQEKTGYQPDVFADDIMSITRGMF
jgi:hypothetical protein